MQTGNYVAGVLAGMVVGATVSFYFTRSARLRRNRKISRQAEAFASSLDQRINQRFEDFLSALQAKEHKRERQNGNGYHPVEADVF